MIHTKAHYVMVMVNFIEIREKFVLLKYNNWHNIFNFHFSDDTAIIRFGQTMCKN